MEDQTSYIRKPKLEDKKELFRIYYNPRLITFDIFLWIEQYSMSIAYKKQWKLFYALYSKSMNEVLVISKN